MKLHLPLSLRSALLAACVIAGLSCFSQAETMTGDFVSSTDNRVTGKAQKGNMTYVSDEDIDLDGAGEYSYYVEIDESEGNVAWLFFKGAADVHMTNMKDIVISGTSFMTSTEGEPSTSTANSGWRDNDVNLTIEDSDSFTFSKNRAYGSTAVLSDNGKVHLRNVKTVLFDSNQSTLMKYGYFTIEGSDTVTFSNNQSIGDSHGAATSGLITLFKDIKISLNFTNNKNSLFVGTDISGNTTSQKFENCKSITFEGNSASTGIIVNGYNGSTSNKSVPSGTTSFINCETVVFRNNHATQHALFLAWTPEFEEVGEVRIEGNTVDGKDGDGYGAIIGQGTGTIAFSSIKKGVYINENKGTTGEKKESSFIVGASMEATGTADHEAEFVVSLNKGLQGLYKHFWEKLSVTDFARLEISENTLNSTGSGNRIGDLALDNVDEVLITGNSLEAKSTTELVGISSLENMEESTLTISSNSISGGSVASGTINLGGDFNSPISVKELVVSDNKITGATKAMGGAIYSESKGVLLFSGNESIKFERNGVESKELGNALGGAIYSSKGVEFSDNDYVLIQGNYRTNGTDTILDAVYILNGDLTFRMKDGQVAECYDAVTVANGTLNIYADSATRNREDIGYVSFSGLNTEKDLAGKSASANDIALSRTIKATDIHVHSGELIVEGVSFNATNTFVSEKEAYVDMYNSSLTVGKTATMHTADFEGSNVITAEQLMAEGGTWTFYVSSENSEKALLSVNPSSTKVTISTKNQKVEVVFDTVLADGAYKLVEFDNTKGTWSNASTLEFSGTVSSKLGSKGKDDVYFTIENNVYILWAEYSSGASAVKPPRPATTLTWKKIGGGIWADAAGMDDGAWSGTVEDLNFYKGDHVVFDKAADVTVGSKVLPASMTVSNTDGQVTFTSANGGQITGSTGIAKSGDGELVLNLANAYTGATAITAGKLTVGDKNALGLSTVELQGGELNLGGLAVNNSVHATKTAVINGGSAYDGKLTLDGGSLTGDALNLTQDAELLSGSIANELTGTGGVVKKGAMEVILTGSNTYTGTTLVSEGTLTLQGASVSGAVQVEKKGSLSLTGNAALNTELTVNGGTLDVQAGSSLHGKMTLNAGSTATVADGFELGAGDKLILAGATVNADVSVEADGVLALTAAQEINGDVKLNGGTLDMQEGSALSVSGSLTIESHTEALLNFAALRAAGDAGLTVLSAASITGEQSDLDFVGLENTRHITDWQDTYVNIKLTSATLIWDADTTNSQWSLRDEANSGDWSTEADETVYYDMDDVIFDNAGEVEIVGTVKPGSITVRGGETTFKGNGNIAGSAELVVDEGTLRVATSNADYTGAITVKANGTLVVDAEKALGSGAVGIDSSNFDSGFFEVDNMVTFSGKSTINAVAARNVVFAKDSIVSGNYTLAPSNTLTVLEGGSTFGEGEFTFAGGTLVLVDNSSQFAIIGTTLFDGMAAMGGKAAAQATTINLTGWTIAPGETYTLMSYTANGMGNPEDYLSLLLPEEWMSDYATLEYSDGALLLTVERPTGNMPQVSQNLSRNKLAAYNVLSNIAALGLAEGTLAKYANRVAGTQDVKAVRELLALLDGEELASAMTSQIEGNMAHLRRLRSYIGSGHLFAPKEGMAAYVTAYNDTHRLHGDAAGPGYRRVEWGASAGVETRLDKDTLVGVGLSDGRARISSTGISATRAHEDTTRVDAYLATDLGGGLQSVTSVGLGFHHYNYRRILPDGERSRTTDMDGASFNFMQEFSCSLYAKDDEVVNAYAGLQSSVNRIGSFSESGAGSASLAGGKRNAWATDISLGLRYAHSFALVEGASAAELSLRSGVVVSVGDTTADLNLHFAGAPAAGYRVSSAHRNRVGYNLSADLLVPVDKDMAITGGAGAILRGDSSEATASVGIRINF